MLLNYIVVVMVVGLASWWLVRAVVNLRSEDRERNDRLDVEAAAILLILSVAGIALSRNALLISAGLVALVAGFAIGIQAARMRRR